MKSQKKYFFKSLFYKKKVMLNLNEKNKKLKQLKKKMWVSECKCVCIGGDFFCALIERSTNNKKQ